MKICDNLCFSQTILIWVKTWFWKLCFQSVFGGKTVILICCLIRCSIFKLICFKFSVGSITLYSSQILVFLKMNNVHCCVVGLSIRFEIFGVLWDYWCNEQKNTSLLKGHTTPMGFILFRVFMLFIFWSVVSQVHCWVDWDNHKCGLSSRSAGVLC